MEDEWRKVNKLEDCRHFDNLKYSKSIFIEENHCRAVHEAFEIKSERHFNFQRAGEGGHSYNLEINNFTCHFREDINTCLKHLILFICQKYT